MLCAIDVMLFIFRIRRDKLAIAGNKSKVAIAAKPPLTEVTANLPKIERHFEQHFLINYF